MLKKHVQNIHIEKKFKCLLCSKVFVDKESLDRHNFDEHGEKRFACNQCGKTFKNKSGLSKHFELHKIKQHGLKYSCIECKRSYSTKSNFDVHLKNFHNGRKFEPRMILDETVSKNLTIPISLQAEEQNSDKKIEFDLMSGESTSQTIQVLKSKSSEGSLANNETSGKSEATRFRKGMWIVKLEKINPSI